MMKLHETRRNMAEDSGGVYEAGGVYKWAEQLTMDQLIQRNSREKILESRKDTDKGK